MKVYKYQHKGLNMQVWNDSSIDWVIQDQHRTVRYPKKTFTRKEAITFHIELHTPSNK